jgi:7-carboxy-7-deazaguanine synthase
VDDLVAEVRVHPARHVVLTGGEPMIAKGIRELAAALRGDGRHVTIETAATVAPDGIACDLASLSPKLANSTPDSRLPEAWRERHEATRWNPDAIRAWVDGYPYQFKFVVSTPDNIAEMEGLIASLDRNIPHHKILLMPEAVSLERMRERAAWLGELCKAKGYRYAHRLHIELYGNKRGT